MSDTFGGKENVCGKKTIIYTTESPLMCMAVNSKAEMVAIAGRNLFQVFSVHEDKFISLHRVKTPSRLVVSDIPKSKTSVTDAVGTECGPNQTHGTTVTATEPIPARHSPVIQSAINQPRSHSVTDVSWSSVGDILATASTSGDVMLWDVGRGMTQTACFSGHNRSIHCIHFNPTISTELVTASQDGKLKLFDIRDPNPSSSCQIFFQRTASPSPVRDVSFCPKQGFLVAAAQENGVISIWDTRKGSRPFRAFQGHSCSIATLDWHPNWNMTTCNWLATAGARDHLIKVWNLNSPSGQSSVTCPSVLYTVRTSNVNRVRWRPTFMTQLVSSCNLTIDLSVHIWDLQRPFIPYVSFEEHKDLVTCISWCPAEANNFYTVGRDGLLIRHSVEDGVRPIENAPPVALSFSPYGHLLHAVRKDRVQINNKLSTVEENSKVSYPTTTKNQPTSVQPSNGNGCSLSYYGPSNPTSALSTAIITTNTTSITTTINNNNNFGDTLLSSKDFEHPTITATSGNVDELVTQVFTNTLIPSESTVNILNNNINTIGTTAINSVTSAIFTNSTFNECTTITTTSVTTASPSSSSPDLPQMGSLKSAQLFVSQAHSLLFHYKPCLETIFQPNYFDFTNALLPDLIILLAKNYKFIGTNVDMICENNASVCLRFGQPFLVRFWLLLRSIYGSLSSDPHKRTSSQQHTMQTQPSTPSHQHQQIYNFSDLDNHYSKHMQSSLINEKKFVPPTDSSLVHIPENRTLKCFLNSGALRRKKRDMETNNTTGIKLSWILESLGIRCHELAQKSTEKSKTNMNMDYRRHSSGNVRAQHHSGSKQFIDTPPSVQKFLSFSGSASNDPSDCVFPNIPSVTNPYNSDCSTLTNELSLRSTKPISVNMNYDSLHKPLIIDNDQLIPSLSSSASPPIIQPSQCILKSLEDDILTNGLLFHNYHEDIDYLFHTSPQEPLEHSPLIENDAVKKRSDQLDLLEVIGSHDDPVIMETEYLPDEAFVTTTNPVTAVNITPELFQNCNQLQHKQKESCSVHHQKRQIMKQNTVEYSTTNDHWLSTSITTSANDICKVVSCCVDIPVSRKSKPSSKLQRKSMDCSKLLASNCRDLSLIDWQNKQILSASSFPGLYTTTTTTTVPLNNDVDCTPLMPSFHSNDVINQEIKKFSDETLVKNDDVDDEHDEVRCHLISQSLLSSSPSQSNTSSLAKQKLLGTCKKSVQLLAPPHHSKSLSGFSKESSMLLNGYTVNSVGSLSPISGEINSIICKWFIKLVESGHVQTVCTALLALGPERLRLSEWISESILEHWFISYLELLSRFRLWTVCARIIKQCGNPFAGADNQTYLRERLRSINHHYVFRPIVMKQPESDSKTPGNTGDTRSDANTRTRWKSGGLTTLAPGVAALNQASTTLSIRCGLCTKPLCASETTQQLTGHTGWACSRHATSFDPATITCALCHLVVRGLFVCCRGCSHGGHLDHMQAWLMRRSECPTGCGHRCRYD
ncbi:unnamed protein product [Schistosoma rodhaini]|uniref:GATOR2 complex protein WDR24 n=1 Tax=Schistosoma rodhaini TaxID=6188 RepID=A0AA85FBK8_9TREM|nr:unnamed protein product [Schistosoma rodhaini]